MVVVGGVVSVSGVFRLARLAIWFRFWISDFGIKFGILGRKCGDFDFGDFRFFALRDTDTKIQQNILAPRGGKRAQKTPNTTKSWGAEQEQKNPQFPQ